MNRFRQQQGMGIVETMVGILIGMIVVVAIYNVFAVAEGYKRTAVGAADAQTTGLYAQFVLAREIANAGNGISGNGGDLATCTFPDPGWVTPAAFFAVPNPRPIRPIPVLIRDGGLPDTPDSLIVTYSSAPRVVSQVLLVDKAMVAVTDDMYVQSPNGFRVNDRIIANAKNGDCETTTVTAVTPGDSTGDVTTGIVGLTHPAVANLYKPGGSTDGPNVVNLGPDPVLGGGETRATRMLFDVFNTQLRSTDLFIAGAAANPIAQNVVLMKAQYGVDCLSNGVVLWTSATASNVCADGRNYTPDDFVPNPPLISTWDGPNLSRIRAIRIGIVVRSDEPDPKDAALTGQTGVLFNCSTNNAACQGRLLLTNVVLADGYRHRFYETVVPMRAAIYNNGS